MNKIIKYTQAGEEQAIIKMYQSGLTAGDKSKIIKARKFPKNAMDNFDLFRTYFLSGEGIPLLIKKLSEREIIVLHILAFNQWITDVRVFEAAYKEMPKPMKYYFIDRGTFTQRYGAVLKAVQTNLVQKGLFEGDLMAPKVAIANLYQKFKSTLSLATLTLKKAETSPKLSHINWPRTADKAMVKAVKEWIDSLS